MKLSHFLVFSFFLAGMSAPCGADQPIQPLRAQEVFDFSRPLIFQDNFASGRFEHWSFSEDDLYHVLHETPERIRIVAAPGWPESKAVRFSVPRAPNSFRAEISLPHEKGWQERWYSERVLIPEDWSADASRGEDIVMQWHAIPGNWRATYPNLSIAVQGSNWVVRQSFGCAQVNPTRPSVVLDEPMKPGAWVQWVVHARWSPDTNGCIRIWRDGRLVLDRTGPNVYSTIGVEYTPYLKTGIYRPAWHTDTPEKRARVDAEFTAATNKVVFVTDVKIGDHRARYEDLAPTVPSPK